MDNPKTKIMIVEDESLLLDAISRKLIASNFDTVPCISAKVALDYLQSNNAPPNAIWLDYYLGDMNGLDFMNKLKESPASANIPVIVVSNSASEEKKKAMLALGAKEYLLKAQYRLDDIIDILKGIVEKNGH